MKNFSFDKSFLKVFDEMNDKLDEMIDSVRKFNVTENEYSICNCSYKMRYITPQNISEYIDLLAKAMYKEMLDTPGDIERFSVECAKRFIKANQCDSFVSAVPLGYTPDPMTYKTLKDIIVGLNNDCFNKNCYSKYDMSQRSEHVKKDLKKITDMKFYVSMKNLVNGIPNVITSVIGSKEYIPDVDVLRESIEAFILFAFAVNTITVSQMHDYLYTNRTVNIKHDDANNVVLTECAIMKTGETDLRINLPFDINFRNIALGSVNNGFKELKDAVKYVLHDPASPVCQMVTRHASFKDVCDNGMLHKIFNTVNTCCCCKQLDPEINWNKIKDEVMKEPNEGYSWLDQLANGNQFIDGSYRTDKQSTGNVTQRPILSSLDMVFKLYNGCGAGLTSNEEIANNILNVECGINTMLGVYEDGKFENPQLAGDVLALLGEILTRDIIMLVNNNTQVIDVSSFTTENNGTPAYLYNEFAFEEYDEEYVMEADNNQNNAPDPKQAKTETPTVTVNRDDGTSKKVTDVIVKFKAWIVKIVSKIYDKFNKDHKMEMDYFNKHQQLNAEIGKSIEDGSFRININKFPEYQVKWDLINPEKISQHVKDWLDVKKHANFDENLFLMGLFPGDEGMKKAIVGEDNQAEKQNKIKNVILYSQIGTPQTYTGELTADVWNNKLLDPYSKSGPLVERYTSALAEQFRLASEAVEKQIQAGNTSGEVKAEDVNKPEIVAAERAKQIGGLLTKYNTLFIVNPINVVMRDFYSTLYTTYASIIKAYKVMSKKKQNTTETNENPPEAANKEENK